MTTLAQVNETLEMHTPLLEDSRDGIVKLEDSFSKFFMGSLDDLESRREAMGSGTSGAPTAGQVQSQQQQAEEGEGLFSRIFEGLGNALSFAAVAGLFRALMKRGIFGVAAMVLADDIGKFVKNMTGSDLLGEITENGIVYASIGAMLFGKKGLIAGAILGAITVFANRITKNIKEHKMAGEYSYAIGEVAGSVFTIASASLAGFLLAGPMGALVGAVVVGAGEIGRLIGLYETDDEFAAQVDGIMDTVKAAIDSLLGKVADTVNMIFDGAIRTQLERKAIQQFNPALYNELVQNEKELAAAVSKYNRLSSIGAPADQIEAARLEMMNVKNKRSALENRIAAEENAYETIFKEGEFGPGAANPNDIAQAEIIKDITTANTGADFRSSVERLALEFGKTQREAGIIAGNVAATSSNLQGNLGDDRRVLGSLARNLGVTLKELEDKIKALDLQPQTNVINAPTTDASSTTVNSQTVSQQSGPTANVNDQVQNKRGDRARRR